MKLCQCGCGLPAPIATRTRGVYVKGKPVRFVHGHNNLRPNLMGQIFGRWKVVKFAGADKYGKSLWLCACSCGMTRTILGNSLVSGNTTGSMHVHKNQHGHGFQNLTGRTFGRWTVLKYAGKRPHTRSSMWWCECKCGTKKKVRGAQLVNLTSTSCGCLRTERITRLGKACRTHGLTHSPTYNTWRAMIQRCQCPVGNHTVYANVKVCKRWLKFENFLADKGIRPVGTTLGRFGDIGDYTDANTKWMTKAEHTAEARKKREAQCA